MRVLILSVAVYFSLSTVSEAVLSFVSSPEIVGSRVEFDISSTAATFFVSIPDFTAADPSLTLTSMRFEVFSGTILPPSVLEVVTGVLTNGPVITPALDPAAPISTNILFEGEFSAHGIPLVGITDVVFLIDLDGVVGFADLELVPEPNTSLLVALCFFWGGCKRSPSSLRRSRS